MAIFAQNNQIAMRPEQWHTAHTTNENFGKLLHLQKALCEKIYLNDWELDAFFNKNRAISNISVAAGEAQPDVHTLLYLRPDDQAQLVEQLMDQNLHYGDCQNVDPLRHPVIEVRLTPDHFAIELVVSPFAWLDQRNLIGKLALPRHRQTLRSLMRDLDDSYYFGFWHGTHLSEMHLTSWQLTQGQILDEWMATFADGQDWLRLGVWHSPEYLDYDSEIVAYEVFQHFTNLYNLYDFMLWTGNNDFRNFYEKHLQHRLHA